MALPALQLEAPAGRLLVVSENGGRADPIEAIADALRFFRADEILVSTRPYGESRWIEEDVVGRAWERFRLPLLHVVEDQAM